MRYGDVKQAIQKRFEVAKLPHNIKAMPPTIVADKAELKAAAAEAPNLMAGKAIAEASRLERISKLL